jgi:NAD(P)-dependent dehydrogenase (short-subunit alcohol dehydrogenase family)
MNEKRYVLVTGASKGIGRATVLQLAQQGFDVFAGVRNEQDGAALQREAGERLTPLLLDVTNGQQIAQAAETIMGRVGQNGLYGLVNNAGIAVAAPLEFVPVDDFRSQIEVNLVGQLAVTQAALPLLRQGRGRIINVSSVGGRVAGTMLGAYHASKFALEALTDTLRQELNPWGITVIAVQPGTIATPIWETSLAAADRLLQRMNPKVHEYYRALIDKTRQNAMSASTRGIAPERVAEVITTALSAARPRTRYTVGVDARIGVHVLTRLPDRLRDQLMAAR